MPLDPQPAPPPSPENRRPRAILWFMVALALWGVWLAVGTYLYRFNSLEQDAMDATRAWRRGLLVLGCTAGFIMLWLLALAVRARRGSRRGSEGN